MGLRRIRRRREEGEARGQEAGKVADGEEGRSRKGEGWDGETYGHTR
jgi:hypothetical protein